MQVEQLDQMQQMLPDAKLYLQRGMGSLGNPQSDNWPCKMLVSADKETFYILCCQLEDRGGGAPALHPLGIDAETSYQVNDDEIVTGRQLKATGIAVDFRENCCQVIRLKVVAKEDHDDEAER
jgi:hypothetical protein